MQQALLSNHQLVGRISRQGICCDSAVIKRFFESEDGACLAKELCQSRRRDEGCMRQWVNRRTRPLRVNRWPGLLVSFKRPDIR